MRGREGPLLSAVGIARPAARPHHHLSLHHSGNHLITQVGGACVHLEPLILPYLQAVRMAEDAVTAKEFWHSGQSRWGVLMAPALGISGMPETGIVPILRGRKRSKRARKGRKQREIKRGPAATGLTGAMRYPGWTTRLAWLGLFLSGCDEKHRCSLQSLQTRKGCGGGRVQLCLRDRAPS